MNSCINDLKKVLVIMNEMPIDFHSYYEIGFDLFKHESIRSLEVIKTLGLILNAKINIQKKNSFYVELASGRALSEFLSDSELDKIKYLAENLNHIPLRGRLYDVLWLYKKPRDRKFALGALQAFSSFEITSENWHRNVKECFYRSLYLPRFDTGDLYYNLIETKILDCFYNTNDSYLFCEVAEMISTNGLRVDDYELINKRLRKFAYLSRKKNDFQTSSRCLTILEGRYKKEINLGNTDHKCQLVNLAHARLLAEEGSNYEGLHAVSCYNEALKKFRASKITLREIYDVDDHISILKAKIRMQGKYAYESMSIIKTESIDISNEIKQTIERVSNKPDAVIALFSFCYAARPANKKYMIKSAIDNLRKYPIHTLFPSFVTDREGRVLAATNGVDLNGINDNEMEKIITPLSQDFAIYVSLQVQARIIPGLRTICEEHYIDYDLIMDLCRHCGFIPDNKVELFTQALQFGFENNFSASVHLLAPLLEDVIRRILYDYGEYTAIIDKHAKSTEVSIATLLDKEKAKEVFDENFLFELKMLLTNNIGSNLRNAAAHGLLDDDTANGGDVVYLWWRILRWVVLSVVIDQDEYKTIREEVISENL